MSIVIDDELCAGCSLCGLLCPEEALEVDHSQV
jgi:NAD-dependent dihydropyrimidine dehydrogenase PreA subunit